MSYKFLHDFKKHITPKTQAVFDLDQICFAAASAAEHHYVKVTHKKTGKIIPYTHTIHVPVKDSQGDVVGYEEKTVKGKYNNKTEFFGSGKDIGGHLATINEILIEKGKTPFVREDFEIEDEYEVLPFSVALRNAEMKIKAICEKLGIEKWLGIIDSADNSNFRLTLPMPVKYKSNRKDSHRPEHLLQLKENFRSRNNVKIITGMESDDYITMYAFKAYQSYKKSGFMYYLPVSFDKDNLGTPYGGLILYNQMKVNGEFKYDAPFLIEGMGTIWMKDKSNSMADGFMQICRQMLLGDWNTDGFSPRSVNEKIRFGEKTCYKALAGCKTPASAVKVVNDTYKKWYPNGVHFTNYDGNQVDMTTEEWQEIIFKCLYMRHDPEDKTSWSFLVKRFSK